jgi:dTDP-3-amino-3,4,6-trideoxy-alpha-D-glucose transaminase
MKVPFLDLGRLHEPIEDELAAAQERVIRRGNFVLGTELAAFEEEFAAWVGATHCVGVGSGTDAIALALLAGGLRPGSHVLVPTNTCSPTWLAVMQAGGVPVGVEPDWTTMLLEADAVQEAWTPEVQAVVPVHLYGLPVDVQAMRDKAVTNAATVVWDAAQAHGAMIDGKRIGSGPEACAWSFYPTKNLGALGDGGAVTTDDEHLADEIRSLRNYGWVANRRYVSEIPGRNSRLDELQAAYLRVKLRYLDQWNARRAEIAETYLQGLQGLPVELPALPSRRVSSWHCFVVRTQDRDALQAALAKEGVGTAVHYPVPPGDQGFARALRVGGPTPEVARRLSRTVLSLPIAPYLRDDEVAYVISAVKRCVAACGVSSRELQNATEAISKHG